MLTEIGGGTEGGEHGVLKESEKSELKLCKDKKKLCKYQLLEVKNTNTNEKLISGTQKLCSLSHWMVLEMKWQTLLLKNMVTFRQEPIGLPSLEFQAWMHWSCKLPTKKLKPSTWDWFNSVQLVSARISTSWVFETGIHPWRQISANWMTSQIFAKVFETNLQQRGGHLKSNQIDVAIFYLPIFRLPQATKRQQITKLFSRV